MSSPVLQAINLHRSYGQTEVLKGVDLTVNKGEVKALLGPSGSGKSTILRLMALLETPDQGEVLLHGKQLGVSVGSTGATPVSYTHLTLPTKRIV